MKSWVTKSAPLMESVAEVVHAELSWLISSSTVAETAPVPVSLALSQYGIGCTAEIATGHCTLARSAVTAPVPVAPSARGMIGLAMVVLSRWF